MMLTRFLVPTFALLSLLASPAGAATYGFYCITGSVAADCATGESQLSVEVADAGPGQALFTFSNSGPNASSITDVYFEDGSLLGISSLIDADDGVSGDPGVDFSLGSDPPDLPGGTNVGFNVTVGFSADSDMPVSQNGVEIGQTLGIVFDLLAGQTYLDVISQLDDGTVRIGIHVQAFQYGGSESFVNVPEPSTGLLALIGFVGMALQRRRWIG